MNARIPLTILIASSIFLTSCDNDKRSSEVINNVQTVSSVQTYTEHTKIKLLQINSANSIELLVNGQSVTIVNPFIEVPHVNLTEYEDHPLGGKTLDYVQQLLQSAKFLTIDYFHDEQHSETGERYGFIKVEHTDLGELLLKQGLAKTVHRYYDNEDFQRYRVLEEESKDEEKGIWVFPNTFNGNGFIKIPKDEDTQKDNLLHTVPTQEDEDASALESDTNESSSSSTVPVGEYQSQILKKE